MPKTLTPLAEDPNLTPTPVPHPKLKTRPAFLKNMTPIATLLFVCHEETVPNTPFLNQDGELDAVNIL